jgi:hypothetical protein
MSITKKRPKKFDFDKIIMYYYSRLRLKETNMSQEKTHYYFTQDSETGSLIDRFHSLEEAKEAIRTYIKEDKEDPSINYIPGFYEIREKNLIDGTFKIYTEEECE